MLRRLKIEDVHLTVAGAGAYGSVSTLNFVIVNTGLMPAYARIKVEFYDVSDNKYSKSIAAVISGRSSRQFTLDEYIQAVRAKIVVRRAFALRPDDEVEVTPT